MAESRLVSARPTPPRRPGAPAPRPTVRPTVPPDDATVVEGPRAVPAPVPTAGEPPPAGPPPSHRAPERPRAEKILLLVLLLGAGLNLGAYLIEGGDLTRLDLTFAGLIFLSGLALVGVTEIFRWTGRT